MGDQISIARARADLSGYINRVAHGKQRIILTSRGRPKAALVSLEDLQTLETGALAPPADVALTDLDEYIDRLNRELDGRFLPDSAELIHAMRVERTEELSG